MDRGTLSQADLASVLDAVQTLNASADIESFPARFVAATSQLIDSDLACYTEINPPRDRVAVLTDPVDQSLLDLLPLFAEFEHQHPGLVAFRENRDGRPLAISDLVSVANWHRTDLYDCFFRQLGLEDQLALCLPTPEPTVVGMALNRARRSFTDRDKAVLNAVRPHVEQAYRHALEYGELMRDIHDCSTALESIGQGVVILASTLDIRHSTRRARMWLDTIFPESKRRQTCLPDELRRWVRRAIQDQALEARLTTPRSVFLQAPNGALEITLLRSDAMSDWILVLEMREAPSPPEMIAGRLPRRLRQVLELLLQGSSEKQVAVALELSPHTVHDYVKSLYGRFEVSSRGELLALWVKPWND